MRNSKCTSPNNMSLAVLCIFDKKVNKTLSSLYTSMGNCQLQNRINLLILADTSSLCSNCTQIEEYEIFTKRCNNIEQLLCIFGVYMPLKKMFAFGKSFLSRSAPFLAYEIVKIRIQNQIHMFMSRSGSR